jgi:hypothetical protein
LASSGDGFILGGARTEPTVALETKTGAKDAGFIFDPALDEQMVAENLGNRTVFLKHLTPFPGLFWKTIEEIESRSIWIHRVLNLKKLPGNPRAKQPAKPRTAGRQA